MMQPLRIVEFLLLLAIANGTPVVIKRLLGDFLAHPLDGGRTFVDGRPLFGSSKTIRGVATSMVATAAFAPVFGVTLTTGLVIALGAIGWRTFCRAFLNVEWAMHRAAELWAWIRYRSPCFQPSFAKTCWDCR